MSKSEKVTILDNVVNLLDEKEFDEFGVTIDSYIYSIIIDELENSETQNTSEIIQGLRKKVLEEYFLKSGEAVKSFILNCMQLHWKKVLFDVWWDFGNVKFPLLQEENYYSRTSLFPEFNMDDKYRDGVNSIQHNANSYIEESIRLIRVASRAEEETQFSPISLFFVDYNAVEQMMTLTEIENGLNDIEYRGEKYTIIVEDKNNMHDILLLLGYQVDPQFSSRVQRAFVCRDSFTINKTIFDPGITLENIIVEETERLKEKIQYETVLQKIL